MAVYEKPNGYFNGKGDEYTLLTPKTRAKYLNALVNNKGYMITPDQFGMSETVCVFSMHERCIAVNEEMREKTIYFRDDDTNDVWCVGGFPYVSEIEEYKCTHTGSSTEISSVHNGIKVTVRYFLPLDRMCEVHSIKVENLSGKKRNISAICAIKPLLYGYKAPKFCGTCSQSFISFFDNNINGLYLDARNPYSEGKPYDGFLISTSKVQSYSADPKHMFGQPFSFSLPYAVLAGGDLDSKTIVSMPMFLALHTKFELAEKEKFETDYIFGTTESIDGAKNMLVGLKTHEDVEREFLRVKKSAEERRGKIFIKTPDEEINRHANYWLKMGIEKNIACRRAPRDNLQFANAGTMFVPEAAKKTIKHIMQYQYNDGHTVRNWAPVDETFYADGPAWLVQTACQYIKFTADTAFLDEVVPYFDNGEGTVWDHIMSCVKILDADRGSHGLQLSHFADWNDALNTGIEDKNSESVFVSMQFADNMRDLKELCEFLGKDDLAHEFADKYEKQKKLINDTCFDKEGYYVRSFASGMKIGSSEVETGSKIFVNSQSWSIISGICPPERVQSVLEAVDKYIETPLGCRVNYPAYDKYDKRIGRLSFQYPGTVENGAVYAHATGFKMFADCLLGKGDRAYRSLKKILPENHTTDISDSLPYTVSSCYILAKETFDNCGNRHWLTGTISWLYRTIIEGIMGVKPHYTGFYVSPALCSEWKNAEISVVRNSTVYEFKIINNNTGKIDLTVNGEKIDGNFVPYSDAEKIEVIVNI